MNLVKITEKFKAGTLLLDEAKSLLSSTVANNVSDRTLKDFLFREISESAEKAMHILILLTEFEVMGNDSEALIKLYEIESRD